MSRFEEPIPSPEWDEWNPDNWYCLLPYVYVFLHERDLDRYAIIDSEDWPWVQRHRWWRVGGQSGKWYAARHGLGSRETRGNLFLHIEILNRYLGLAPEPGMVGDHINGDSMDCRRRNLKWATKLENAKNNKRRKKRGTWQ